MSLTVQRRNQTHVALQHSWGKFSVKYEDVSAISDQNANPRNLHDTTMTRIYVVDSLRVLRHRNRTKSLHLFGRFKAQQIENNIQLRADFLQETEARGPLGRIRLVDNAAGGIEL